MRFLAAILCAAVVLMAADAITAGKYTGKWQGDSGAGGEFFLSLSGGSGTWKAEVSFTMSDQNVPCKVTALSVDSGKVHVVYTFDLLGNKLESTIDGERTAGKLIGKYRTRSTADGSAVDQGTWEANLAK